MVTSNLKLNPMLSPDYNQIFEDMINKKHINYTPSTLEKVIKILKKNELKTSLEILDINDIMFSDNNSNENRRLRSYKEEDIKEILNFIEKTGYSKRKVAKMFDIAFGTMYSWIKKNKKNDTIS